MSQWTKLFIAAAAALILVVLVLVFMIFNFDSGDCHNRIHQEYRSPGNVYKALVFERQCGGNERYSTQVYLLKANDPFPTDAGNILILDGRASLVAPTLYWNLPNELWIYHHVSGNEYRLENSWHGNDGVNGEVRIQYKSKPQ
ncbi:hypothetical protein [Aliikangiella sp. G2MR2-5]|uniref:hypothetical protein n=1 Tax=Aliikangiella sp. G2MR2-5 TaxID=2788943 RepID=UPI0018A8BA4D|nr:hypothetical protein [Aliikangiella sp. G2MR2-5]